MAGGSLPHAKIVVDLLLALDLALRGKSSDPYGTALAIKIPDAYVFPDASVVCGEPDIYSNRGNRLHETPYGGL